ncbi:MAG: hypothetical protein JNM90_09165, partial [Burkholderiales bacterium]|nr:hypothetical protein [Burkholderiales bacterium]
MDRRTAVLALGSFGAFPGAASAQARGKAWRVGFLSPRTIGDLDEDFFGALPRALRELGYAEGKNLVIVWRSAEGSRER